MQDILVVVLHSCMGALILGAANNNSNVLSPPITSIIHGNRKVVGPIAAGYVL